MNEPTTTRNFRLPVSLLDRVKQFADRMQREAPAGVRISVTSAVIFLLTYALDQLEGSQAIPGSPGGQ